MATIELPLGACGHLLHEPARRSTTEDAVHLSIAAKVPCTAHVRLVDTTRPRVPRASLAEATSTSRRMFGGVHLLEVSLPIGPAATSQTTDFGLSFDSADIAPFVADATLADLALLLGNVSVIDSLTPNSTATSGMIPIAFGPLDLGTLDYRVDHEAAIAPIAEALRTGLKAIVSRATSARIARLVELVAPGSTRRRRPATYLNALSVAQLADLSRVIAQPHWWGFDRVTAEIVHSLVQSLHVAYNPIAAFVGMTTPRVFGFDLGPQWMPAAGVLSASGLRLDVIGSVADLATRAIGGQWCSSCDLVGLGGQLDLGKVGPVANASDASLGERFDNFLAHGTLTAALTLNPLGLPAVDVQARIVLPNFAKHPSTNSWSPPEDRRRVRGLSRVSRAELLRAAGPAARGVLGDAGWDGSLRTLTRSLPRGRAPVTGLDLGRDYFPHGGLLAAGRLRIPRLLSEPPLGDIAEALTGLSSAGRRTALDLVVAAASDLSDVGDIALYIPAPNPPDPDRAAAFQLADLREGDSSAAGSWPLEHAFLAGTINGSLLGINLAGATFEMTDGALVMDIVDQMPRWLTSLLAIPTATMQLSNGPTTPIRAGVGAIRAALGGSDVAEVAARSASRAIRAVASGELLADTNQATEELGQRLQTELVKLLEGPSLLSPDELINSAGTLIADALPKVRLNGKVNGLRLPRSVARWLRIATGPIELTGYSPFFDMSDNASGAQRFGGLELTVPRLSIDLGPVAEMIDSPRLSITPPATARGAAGLRGRFELPTMNFAPFIVAGATIDVDTTRSSPVIAYVRAEPLQLGPMRITPTTTSHLELTIDATTGRVEVGPAQLSISTPYVELTAELFGEQERDSFAFSLTDDWAGTARLSRLTVRNPFDTSGRPLLDLRRSIDVLIAGSGGIASLGAVWSDDTPRKISLFPSLGFGSDGPFDLIISAAGGIAATVHADLGRAIAGLDVIGDLRFGVDDNQPFAALEDATATLSWLPGATYTGSFTMSSTSIECFDGTLSAPLLSELFDAAAEAWHLSVDLSQRRPSLSLTGTVEGFDLGVFSLSGVGGNALAIDVGPDGVKLGPAHIEAALAGLTLSGTAHGRRRTDPLQMTSTDWDASITIDSLEIGTPFSDAPPAAIPVGVRGQFSAVGTAIASLAVPEIGAVPLIGDLLGETSANVRDALTIDGDGSWRSQGSRTLDLDIVSAAGDIDIGATRVGTTFSPFLTLAGSVTAGAVSFSSTLSWDGEWWKASGVSTGVSHGIPGLIEVQCPAWEFAARSGPAAAATLSATVGTGASLSVFGQGASGVGDITVALGSTGLVITAGSDGWINLATNLARLRVDDVTLDTSAGSAGIEGRVEALRQGGSWRLGTDVDWHLSTTSAAWETELLSGSGFGNVLPTQGLLHRSTSTALILTRNSAGFFGLRADSLQFSPLWNTYSVDGTIGGNGAISVAVDGAAFVSDWLTLNAGTMTVEANLRLSELGAKWEMLAGTISSSVTDWPPLTFPGTPFTTSQNLSTSASTTPDEVDKWTTVPGVPGAEYKCSAPSVRVELSASDPRLAASVNLGSISMRPKTSWFFPDATGFLGWWKSWLQDTFTFSTNPGALAIESDGTVTDLDDELAWPASTTAPWWWPIWAGDYPPVLPTLSQQTIKLQHLLE